MDNKLDSLVRLKPSQSRAAAEVLARAFFNDPLFVYLFPDAKKRFGLSAWIIEYWLRHDLVYGEVYAPSEKLEGVAAWVRSDKGERTLWRMLRSRAYGLYRQLDKLTGGKERLFHNVCADMQKRSVSGRHWYLEVIGVEPQLKGKGYAGRLLRSMLERIDKEGLPCYLETENPKNITLYEHFGFKVTVELVVPGSNFKMFALVRLPSTKKGG